MPHGPFTRRAAQQTVRPSHINELQASLENAPTLAEAGGAVLTQTGAPLLPTEGALWYDTDELSGGPLTDADINTVATTINAKIGQLDVRSGNGGPSFVYLNHPQYGVVGNGVANDSAAFAAALADIGPRGGTLLIDPGHYLVPNGITENIPGLRVIGNGVRLLAPGEVDDWGVVIQSTIGGEWTWQHGPNTVTNNVYAGVTFENITFMGNNSTSLGGLFLRTNNNRVVNCSAYRYKTGYGYRTLHPGGSGDDASWNHLESCYSVDNLYGFDIGGGVVGGGSGSEIVGCITMKTGNPNAVITRTGWGMRISSSNVTVLGGKVEFEDVGVLVTAAGGVSIVGTRSEQSNTAVKFARAVSEVYPSNNSLVAPVAFTGVNYAVEIGANEWNDVIVGNQNLPILDNGRGTRIVGAEDTLNAQSLTSPFQVIKGFDGPVGDWTAYGGGNLTYEVLASNFGAGMFYMLPNSANTFFRVQNSTTSHFTVNGNGTLNFHRTGTNPDTSAATLVQLEAEVNELKATLRSVGLLAT